MESCVFRGWKNVVRLGEVHHLYSCEVEDHISNYNVSLTDIIACYLLIDLE